MPNEMTINIKATREDVADLNPMLTKVLENALSVPGIKVNRSAFLESHFEVKEEDKTKLFAEGPSALFDKKHLDKVADKSINWLTSESAMASFALGLPGGFAMIGSIPADIIQNMALCLRLAQELGYIYGINDIFGDNGELTEESYRMLITYLGVMFGAQGAGSLLRTASVNAGTYVAKQFMKSAPTKGVLYPLLKEISKVVASKTLTKQSVAKGLSKAIPVIGGAISGGVTLATMLPMAHRLKDSLGELVYYSETDYKKDVEIIKTIIVEVNDETLQDDKNMEGKCV